jgi:hypothetical protein
VAPRENADAGSVRNAIRWGLFLAAVGTAGFRIPRLVNEFRAWRDALRLGDSSSADGWHNVLTVDLISVVIVVALGGAAFYFLRPKAKPAE